MKKNWTSWLIVFLLLFCNQVAMGAGRLPNQRSQPQDWWTTSTDLRLVPTNLTGADIDNAIRSIRPDSPLIGLGDAVILTGQQYSINPVYIISHAIWESAWGTSAIARDKNNLFGFGAFDSDPYNGAYTYSSFEDCIQQVMQFINDQYLTPGGSYYNGSTLSGMNVRYATDPNWANGIASVMNSLQGYLPDPIFGELPTPTCPADTVCLPNFSPAIGPLCDTYWYEIPGYSGYPAYLTLNVQSAANSTNSAEWSMPLAEGVYDIQAYIPSHSSINWSCFQINVDADTSTANYIVEHGIGERTSVSIDQLPLNNQWVSLGTSYNCFANSGCKVLLTDITSESDLARNVSFSAVRFIYQHPIGIVTPSPTPVVGGLIANLQSHTGNPYVTGVCNVGSSHYADRTTTITGFSDSAYAGVECIRTANDDKYDNQSNMFEFDLLQSAEIAVCIDQRTTTNPDWLAIFNATGETISVSDSDMSYCNLYSCNSQPGHIVMSGSQSGNGYGNRSNYFVMLRPINSGNKLCTAGSQTVMTPTPTSPSSLPTSITLKKTEGHSQISLYPILGVGLLLLVWLVTRFKSNQRHKHFMSFRRSDSD